MELLPRDKYTMFVPPCPQSYPDNIEFRLYYPPATRRKARYLGIYANKSVRAIGLIGNVVSCDVDVDGGKVTVRESTRPMTTKEEQRIVGASRKARSREWA